MLLRDRYMFVMATKAKRIGILTAGGDSPGLNAAIRGVGKAALGYYGWEIVGFRDGFRGLVENRRITALLSAEERMTPLNRSSSTGLAAPIWDSYTSSESVSITGMPNSKATLSLQHSLCSSLRSPCQRHFHIQGCPSRE